MVFINYLLVYVLVVAGAANPRALGAVHPALRRPEAAPGGLPNTAGHPATAAPQQGHPAPGES